MLAHGGGGSGSMVLRMTGAVPGVLGSDLACETGGATEERHMQAERQKDSDRSLLSVTQSS